jgi:glyoxalase-like protein
MPAILDHAFICTAAGAPGADCLRQFGLTEGSPNRHPGQGTACRRFFFRDAMLELLWVEDEADARSEQTRRTRLWERWREAGCAASPFGIVLRPAPGMETACPFHSWEYRPASMPDLALHIAEDAGIEEPMWCYLEASRAPADAPPERLHPMEHASGFREVTGVRVVCPSLAESSVTRRMARAGVIDACAGSEHLLELHFDHGDQGKSMDFRGDLPLIFRW